jgi:VWFA-related protein
MRIAGSAVAALVALGSAAAQPQPGHFTSGREAVRVDVLVTEGGQPLAGLGLADFEVFDNGVAQHVDLISFDEVPLNVVLAFDTSDSVAGERIEHLRTAGRSVLDRLTARDQAALVTFSHVVTQHSRLTADLPLVREALDAAPTPGDTALVDGVYTAMIAGESDAGRALVIAFSDGVDNSSWLSPDAVLETAKRADVVVYAVATGRPQAFLRDLTRFTGGSLVDVESTRNIDATFTRILDEFRRRYLISYSPEGVTNDGWHRLDVRVKRRGATVRSRPGYLRDRRP